MMGEILQILFNYVVVSLRLYVLMTEIFSLMLPKLTSFFQLSLCVRLYVCDTEITQVVTCPVRPLRGHNSSILLKTLYL